MSVFEPAFSPQESLTLIAEVISKTKEKVKEQSFCFLLWGWLISIASILFFVLQRYTTFKLYFLPFPILSVAGIVATILFFIKRLRSTETYLNYFLNRMWMVLGAGFISVVFINVSHQQAPFTYTLLIAAIGTSTSGLIMHFKPMIIGGCALLVSAIVSAFIPAEYTALLHGAAIIVGYLIPGYMLRYSKDIL